MKKILIIMSILVVLMISCTAPCPPGTTLGSDGVCCEGEDGVCSDDAEETKDVKDKETATEKTIETDKDSDKEDSEESGSDSEESDEKENDEGAGGSEESQESEESEESKETNSDGEAEGESEENADSDEETDSPGPSSELEKSEYAGKILTDLKNAYTEKVTSYKFKFDKKEFYIKDNKITIRYPDVQSKRDVTGSNGENIRVFYYDVIYSNITSDTGRVFCEGYETSVQKQCQQAELEDIYFNMNYSDETIKLPHEWLLEAYVNGTVLREEADKYYVDNRDVTLVEFPNVDIYFDPRNGLPMKIVDKTTNGEIKFADIIINTVKDTDMEHLPYEEYVNLQ